MMQDNFGRNQNGDKFYKKRILRMKWNQRRKPSSRYQGSYNSKDRVQFSRCKWLFSNNDILAFNSPFWGECQLPQFLITFRIIWIQDTPSSQPKETNDGAQNCTRDNAIDRESFGKFWQDQLAFKGLFPHPSFSKKVILWNIMGLNNNKKQKVLRDKKLTRKNLAISSCTR